MPVARKKKTQDDFSKDPENGEWEKPGPKMDPDAAAIASAISKINKRERTGVVLNWNPKWTRKHNLPPFTFYFFDDKLAVDFFNREAEEMDALHDDLTQRQKGEIASKSSLCAQNEVTYLYLGPDDDLDLVQLAAKLGKTSFKKGQAQQRKAAKDASDGIEEEGDDF